MRKSTDTRNALFAGTSRGFLFSLAAFALFSCAAGGPPRIQPVDFSESAAVFEKCDEIFPSGDWNFVHSIEATFAGGKKAFMTGVTRVSERGKNIRSVMMSLEGLVVFDVLHDGNVVVNRAVYPFDSEDFARGLIRDARLMFSRPESAGVETGLSDDGVMVCRYRTDGATATDLNVAENEWTLRLYNRGVPVRTVRAHFNENSRHPKIPETMELTAHGTNEYKLDFKLLEAERVSE